MKKLNYIIVTFLLFFLLFTGCVNAEELENETEVEPKSELTYYLKITYDGVDVKGVNSESNSCVADVYSDTIYVEDKIPSGLKFIKFVTTSDGTFNAVSTSTGGACSGEVIDDTNDASVTEGTWNENKTEYTYHGLHYSVEDNTVRCKIKKLQAGGELVIGIVTETPTIDDDQTQEIEHRRDFYNYASVLEGAIRKFSNVVHVFMKDKDVDVYDVEYQYEGEVPAGVAELPIKSSYAENAKVGVASDVPTEDYEFSGWETSDATITNRQFIMPNKKVLLKGSFSQSTAEKYKVTYRITGEMPEEYDIPQEKEYTVNSVVNVDLLQQGDIVNGYKFSGWTTPDVTVSGQNDFIMEAKNVVFTGSFEKIEYKVEYKFIADNTQNSGANSYESVLPENSDKYLPATSTYAPGTKVKVAPNPTIEGYIFSGWSISEDFKMPEEDVVIYGEWIKVTGTFEPKIEKEIVNNKDSYKTGDVVDYKITITNQNEFEIKDVLVKENNPRAKFKNSDNYVVESSNLVTIKSIPAGGKAEIYAAYTVTDDDKNTVHNEAEIRYAAADNGYVLKDREYKASCDFKVGTANVEEKTEDKTEEVVKTDDKTEKKEETEAAGKVENNNEDSTENNVEKDTNDVVVENSKDKLNPKTGDKIYYFVGILGLAVVILVKIRKINKRNRNTKRR